MNKLRTEYKFTVKIPTCDETGKSKHDENSEYDSESDSENEATDANKKKTKKFLTIEEATTNRLTSKV